MMSPERLLNLLLQDSPRLLGEAAFCLRESREWVGERGVRSLQEPDSPLIRFYRCIHAFKGMCSMMSPRLPLASELLPRFHEMEGRLAIRDRWGDADIWLPELEAGLEEIRSKVHEAGEQRSLERLRSSGESQTFLGPGQVHAISGGRELTFPWPSILGFIPGDLVAGRPVIPVGDRLVAVVPSSGQAHEGVLFGVVVKTKSGQQIVVPVQTLELATVESVSTAIRTAA